MTYKTLISLTNRTYQVWATCDIKQSKCKTSTYQRIREVLIIGIHKEPNEMTIHVKPQC